MWSALDSITWSVSQSDSEHIDELSTFKNDFKEYTDGKLSQVIMVSILLNNVL